MFSRIDPSQRETQDRLDEPSSRLYLWVVTAVLVLQCFRVVGGITRSISAISGFIDVWPPSRYWLSIIPIHTCNWLILVPFIAAVIVFARKSFRRSVIAHTVLFLVATYASGLYLQRFVQLQIDQMNDWTSARIVFDSDQAVEETTASYEEARVDQTAASVRFKKSSDQSVQFRKFYRGTIAFGRIPELVTDYLMMIGVGYAVLYFRLTAQQTRQAQHLRTALVQLQHESLCNRLTPHFLFNTLNTISSLTLTDGAAARTCISQLGELLRESIEALPEGEIRLQKELDILCIYLSIQKTRFGPTLDYTIDVEPGLEGALVPAFLLQPLVENCFKHGFQERVQSAHLGVSIKRQGEYCRMEVQDNGKQIEPAEALDERLGLGLTRQRLNLQYGGDAQLLYEANLPSGLKVIVLVPIHGQNGTTA